MSILVMTTFFLGFLASLLWFGLFLHIRICILALWLGLLQFWCQL